MIVNIYLIIINIITLFLMFIDKIKAINHKQRIRERLIITLSFLGGSIGTLLGMLIMHHKIRKKKFIILVPLALILLIISIFIYIKIPQ